MSRVRVARNAVFSVLQVLVSAVAMVLTYRQIMRSLPIEAIGLWSLIIGSAGVARLTEMGLGAGALRFIAADIGADKRDRAAGVAGMASLSVVVLVGGLALASRPFLLHYLVANTPPAMADAIEPLLDSALSSVVLGTVGNVVFSAIDGCQRMDLRTLVQVIGSFVQLGVTCLVLPRLGLAGLGLAAVAQSVIQVALGLAILLALLGTPLRNYFAFDRSRFRELIFYGGALQISGLAQLLFEPLIKVLLAHFSGLALTGYFDMATRIIQQLRSLIVAAYNSMVPHIAAATARGGLNPAAIRSIYSEACQFLVFITLPYFTGIAAALPLALTLWKGHFDAVFLAVALVQFAGWFVNVFNIPSYLMFIATGQLRWNIGGHVLTGILTMVLGFAFGNIAGGPGVLAAGAGGLIAGSLLSLIAFHREFNQSYDVFFDRRWAPLATALLGAFGTSVAIVLKCKSPSVMLLLAPPTIFGVLTLILSWRDPQRGRLISELFRLIGR